jgi:hypothetical protein
VVDQRVTLVYGPNWTGLYVGGALVREDFTITAEEALAAVGVPVSVVCTDDDWFQSHNLPSRLENVERMKRV